MPFAAKSKVGIEAFCRGFYAEFAHNLTYWQLILSKLVDAHLIVDPSTVDESRFYREMTALRYELFALAWAHQHKQRTNYTLPQLAFTKRYLEDMGESELWQVMGEYCGAVGQSQFGKPSGSKRIDASVDAMVLRTRLEVWKELREAGVDEELAARAVGHFLTERSWRKNITIQLLVHTLTTRLQWQALDEGNFQLSATMYGLYEGAKLAIKEVIIVPDL